MQTFFSFDRVFLGERTGLGFSCEDQFAFERQLLRAVCASDGHAVVVTAASVGVVSLVGGDYYMPAWGKPVRYVGAVTAAVAL